MAYQPSLEDIPQTQSYQPSLSDIDEVHAQQAGGAQTPLENKNVSYWENQMFQPSGGMSRTEALGAQSRGFLSGLLDLGRGLANILPGAEEMAGIPQTYKPLTAEQVGENKLLPEEMAKTPEAQRGKLGAQLMAGAAVPFGAVEEAGIIPQLMGAGKTFLGSEALGAAMSPDEQLEKSLKENLWSSAGLASLGPLLSGGKAGLSGLLKQGGTATPEEFERNVRAGQQSGVELPLGQTAASPLVAGTQSILSKIPGVGSAQDFIKSGKILKKETGSTLDSLNTMPEKDLEGNTTMQQLSNKVNEKFLNLKKQDSANYRKVDDIAKESGAMIGDRSATQQVANERLEQLKQQQAVNPNRKIDSQLFDDLTDASLGNPMPFSLAGPEKSRYRDLMKSAFNSGDTYKGAIYSDLLKAHSKDVVNNLASADNPELKEAFENANKFHAEKIAPIKNDKDLYRYAQGEGDADLLAQSFVKGGQYDRPDKAKAIYSMLDPHEQNQLTHEILTRSQRLGFEGEPEIREDKALNHFNNIGDETKEIMFQNAPEQKNKLSALSHTRKLFDTNLNQMSNPKTGEQGAKQFWMKMAALGALGGAGYGEYKGGESPGTVAATLLGVPLGLRSYSKYLKSDLAKSAYRAGGKLEEKPTSLSRSVGLVPLMKQKEENNE